jgi:hypothetical protein
MRESSRARKRQKRKEFSMKRIGRPGTILGVIAVVVALAGTAVAAGNLRLADFESSSRDRLAGTGVIQFAAQAHNTGMLDAAMPKTFSVKCELSKKATAGGFKWTGASPPKPADYEYVDGYPNGGGFVVRIYILGPTAENQPLSVFSNCVKSRKQNGAPPA